ncbi:TolC family protein [Rhodoblastus acidophilus]|uniref:TolC family protein n=1 Tax=Candidatus Rhodoblastus alkanivorans TaxID=2954117 RepID=A0ABS9Z3F0_9HYPH|nr:TolC family protein [Candidatus Rhodoblastus alkanivorans]MCI4677398.1 TolC family protein [Candidatus Rhodoblastus alkanivorans]MCI4682133.1 TolC family protein [Candidatus Rhodoblastus alkanivorans]MDI4639435.1 TolC family protein [Rhodoblastus acidophilus]
MTAPRLIAEPGMRAARHVLILFAVAAPLGGCESYRPAPISAARSAAALDARSLGDPRLQTFIAAAESASPANGGAGAWGLDKLTLAALYYHPDLDIARSKLAEARAGVVTAATIPNPTLSFEELSYNASLATPSPWVAAPIVNFLIETYGKREFRTARASHLVEAAREDVATASWQVRGRVRNALIDLSAAKRRSTLLQQRLALQNELVTLLEHRLSAGAVSSLDLARERIARDRAELEARDAEGRLAEARNALAAAIGVPAAALDGVDLSFTALEHPAPPKAAALGSLRREALVGRSDVQSLLADYAAAESALALQVASQYPNLKLGPGYIYDQGQSKFMLLPETELPIFNQNQGPIAEAKARRAAAAARFTALQTRILNQVDGAAARYFAAARAFDAAKALADRAAARQSSVEHAFRAGEIDRPSLLTGEIEGATAKQSLLDAEVQRLQALGGLEDALQHRFLAASAPLPVVRADPRRPVEGRS